MKAYWFLIAALGILLGIRVLVFWQNAPHYQAGQPFSANYTFLSNPTVKYGSQIFTVNGVTIYAPEFPSFSYGDRVQIKGVIGERGVSRTKTSGSSKKGDQVTKILVLKNPRINNLNQNNLLIASAARVRSVVTRDFHNYLGNDEAALLLGVVFGIKENMSQTLYTGFKNTGVLHVIAASGENVSIVSGFLLALFSHFMRRKYAIVLTILAIGYYAILSGLDPSIVRASLMGIFAFGALFFGRQYYGLFALMMVAWIMLMINPLQVTDVGFLLSFSSTLGIITIYPLLSKLWIFQLPLLDDVSTTLAAQIASIPVMLYFFSTYSTISILVNMLVLWTVPILMMLGGVAALIFFIPILSGLLLYLAYPLLLYFEKMTLFFSQKPLNFELSAFPISIIIGYYFLLAAVILHLKPSLKTNEK